MPKPNAMVTFEFWTFFCSSRFRRPGSVHRFGKWTNWAVSRQPEASAHTSWPCFIHSDYLPPVNISLCQNRQSIFFGFVFHRILMWVRDFFVTVTKSKARSKLLWKLLWMLLSLSLSHPSHRDLIIFEVASQSVSLRISRIFILFITAHSGRTHIYNPVYQWNIPLWVILCL